MDIYGKTRPRTPDAERQYTKGNAVVRWFKRFGIVMGIGLAIIVWFGITKCVIDLIHHVTGLDVFAAILAGVVFIVTLTVAIVHASTRLFE